MANYELEYGFLLVVFKIFGNWKQTGEELYFLRSTIIDLFLALITLIIFIKKSRTSEDEDVIYDKSSQKSNRENYGCYFFKIKLCKFGRVIFTPL